MLTTTQSGPLITYTIIYLVLNIFIKINKNYIIVKNKINWES